MRVCVAYFFLSVLPLHLRQVNAVIVGFGLQFLPLLILWKRTSVRASLKQPVLFPLAYEYVSVCLYQGSQVRMRQDVAVVGDKVGVAVDPQLKRHRSEVSGRSVSAQCRH